MATVKRLKIKILHNKCPEKRSRTRPGSRILSNLGLLIHMGQKLGPIIFAKKIELILKIWFLGVCGGFSCVETHWEQPWTISTFSMLADFYRCSSIFVGHSRESSRNIDVHRYFSNFRWFSSIFVMHLWYMWCICDKWDAFVINVMYLW